MLLIFVLARKRRLDLVTVRAVAERRPPERRVVEGKTRSYRIGCMELDFGNVVLLADVLGVGKSGLS